MNDDENNNPPEPSLATMLANLLRTVFTDVRIAGYFRQAGTWLATYLTLHNWLPGDNETTGVVVASTMQIGMILWSWNTGAKTELREKLMGVARHLLSVMAAVAVFKGWLSDGAASQISALVIGVFGTFALSASAGEKSIPVANKPN